MARTGRPHRIADASLDRSLGAQPRRRAAGGPGCAGIAVRAAARITGAGRRFRRAAKGTRKEAGPARRKVPDRGRTHPNNRRPDTACRRRPSTERSRGPGGSPCPARSAMKKEARAFRSSRAESSPVRLPPVPARFQRGNTSHWNDTLTSSPVLMRPRATLGAGGSILKSVIFKATSPLTTK